MSAARAVVRFFFDSIWRLIALVTGLAALEAYLNRRLAAKWDALAADCDAEGLVTDAADARYEAARLRAEAEEL